MIAGRARHDDDGILRGAGRGRGRRGAAAVAGARGGSDDGALHRRGRRDASCRRRRRRRLFRSRCTDDHARVHRGHRRYLERKQRHSLLLTVPRRAGASGSTGRVAGSIQRDASDRRRASRRLTRGKANGRSRGGRRRANERSIGRIRKRSRDEPRDHENRDNRASRYRAAWIAARFMTPRCAGRIVLLWRRDKGG